jgi:phage protein D
MAYTTEDKMKIRNQLVKDTGFPLKRVENYLQRFNWDLKKLYDYPVIKSAIKKTKAEAAKAKALEDIDLKEDNVSGAKSGVPKKSKKKGVEHDKIGNEIEVHDDGSKWFRGKLIHNDSSGLYAPYLTQKEIISWVKQYGAKPNDR